MLLNKIKFLIFFLTISSAFTTKGQQSINITGQWNGIIGIPLGEDIVGEYYFNQNGTQLTGHVKTNALNKRDSSDVVISGTIKGNTIHFKSTEFIYRVGPGCLSVTDLEYSVKNGIERLTGKWKGDWATTTCPPGVSGNINLLKLSEVIKEKIAPDQSTINEDDYEGLALQKELLKRNYYALVIGVQQYTDDNIHDLDHPIKDAKSIQDVLLTYYTFPSENIFFLSNPTRTTIIEAFDDLSNRVTENDLLLIFYAGHGIWDHQLKQGFWLPSDANHNSKAHWLSNSTIRDYIGGINSKHTLLITDACFSGSIFKERGINFESSKAMLEMYRLTSRKAMTSGTLKTVPDKSVFIKYLIKNLQDNTHPLLSAEELFQSFKIAVINNSPNGQVPQYGAIGQVGDEGGDFIFLKK